jgi:hypothetical protein
MRTCTETSSPASAAMRFGVRATPAQLNDGHPRCGRYRTRERQHLAEAGLEAAICRAVYFYRLAHGSKATTALLATNAGFARDAR